MGKGRKRVEGWVGGGEQKEANMPEKERKKRGKREEKGAEERGQ